jgi:hypothetical protein
LPTGSFRQVPRTGGPGQERLFANGCFARSQLLRGKLGRVSTPITVSIPHQLGRAEARRRLENGFPKLAHVLPGIAGSASERWDGDRLIFSVAAIGQTVSGTIDVSDTVVVIQLQLSGLLGMVAGRLKDRLQKTGQLLLRKD